MIVTEFRDAVALITIDRPERRNALDLEHCQLLHAALDEARETASRAVVITGAGSAFCAGADLGGVYGPEFRQALYAMLGAMTALPTPVIAAVNGPAIGAGTQVAIAADLRVARPTARFGVPTARLGLAVDGWTVRRLALLAGGGPARALLIGCDEIDGAAAHRLGLVERLGELDDALAWAATLAGLAPLTLAYNKVALERLLEPLPMDPVVAEAFEACWASEDFAEGQAASKEKRPPPVQGPMKPAPFAYVRPVTVQDAVAALRDDTEAKLLAGGQSLVPLMNLRLARPTVIVDLNRVEQLQTITVDEGHLCLGAMVRHGRLASDPVVGQRAPLLAHAASWIGHSAIHARGTIGGSLAHADPAAELPLVVQALDAEIDIVGPSGLRRVPAASFFVGPLQTVLEPDELIVSTRIPLDAGGRDWGFAELCRRHGDFALVLAAVTLTVDADGVCRQATVGFGGAGPAPTRVGASGRALVGTRLDDHAVARAVRGAMDAAKPSDDIHGSATYRRAMVGEMVRLAIDQARGMRS